MQDVKILAYFSINKWTQDISDINPVLNRMLVKNFLIDERIISGLGRYANTTVANDADVLMGKLPDSVNTLLRSSKLKSINITTESYPVEWDIAIRIVI